MANELEKIKERLKNIENIKFSRHAKEKTAGRRIDNDMLETNLRNPENLIACILEKDKYPGEKYELYFRLTKRKSLKIVVSFIGKDLNVVTTHTISNKRMKLVERWRKRHL